MDITPKHLDKKLTIKARRVLAFAADAPLPMNKNEAKRFCRMVYDFVTTDIGNARRQLDWRGQEGLELIHKLDRISNYAWYALCNSYKGDR
jgi:hypothetical protein